MGEHNDFKGGGGGIFLALKVKDDVTKCYDIILIPISDSWASFLSRKMIGCALFFFFSFRVANGLSKHHQLDFGRILRDTGSRECSTCLTTILLTP